MFGRFRAGEFSQSVELRPTGGFGFLFYGNPVTRRRTERVWRLGCAVAMEALQRSCGVLGKCVFTPGLAVDGEREAARVAFPVSSAAGRLQRRECCWGLAWRPEAPRAGRDPLARSVTTRAALLRGLGGALKSGYVLRHHEIVDEHTAVENTGDVIEKLKNGFKNFKTTEYKYVVSYSRLWTLGCFSPLL